MKIWQTITFLALFANAIAPTCAQTHAPGQAATKLPSASAAASGTLSSGEVLKVYAKEKRILLKHGPIPSMGMGAMTMEFGLADPKMLGSLKPGDTIRFSADEVKGDYVVTRIEVLR